MNIITGYLGEPHITSQEDRNVNRAIFGDAAVIADVGRKLAVQLTSATQLVVFDGVVIAQGCAAEVPAGTSESFTIRNGGQYQLRRDLLVATYRKESGTGVESMELRILTGTPATSNPSLPTYSSGQIVDGSRTRDFPLYEIQLDGLTVSNIVQIAPVMPNIGSVNDGVDQSLQEFVTMLGVRPKCYVWWSADELKTDITLMEDKEVFLFRTRTGNDFTQEVFDMQGDYESFGLGWHQLNGSVFLVGYSHWGLHISLFTTDGLTEAYHPLYLRRDA